MSTTTRRLLDLLGSQQSMAITRTTPISGVDYQALKYAMKQASIPGVSIAEIDGQLVRADVLGMNVHPFHDEDLTTDSPFGAASLSKTVFAFLVLKLLDDNVLDYPLGLDTPISSVLSFQKFCSEYDLKVMSSQDGWVKDITIRMVLSHSSGLDNALDSKIHFQPGTEYRYSGFGLMYLQAAIERQLGSNLEAIAKKHLFKPLGLHSMSFKGNNGQMNPNAANSLVTSASDYMKLVSAWLNRTGHNCLQAFQPQISLHHDKWARDLGVDAQTLSHLSWGLGFALELDDTGTPTKAFHTGDMNKWRSQVVVDLQTHKGIAYFSSGARDDKAHGHTLSDFIVKPSIDLKHGFKWFYKKFRFARTLTEDWRRKERVDGSGIGHYLKTGTLPKPVPHYALPTISSRRKARKKVETTPQPRPWR